MYQFPKDLYADVRIEESYDLWLGVKNGDEITVSFGTRQVTVRVLDIKETTKKSECQGMYEVISESEA